MYLRSLRESLRGGSNEKAFPTFGRKIGGVTVYPKHNENVFVHHLNTLRKVSAVKKIGDGNVSTYTLARNSNDHFILLYSTVASS